MECKALALLIALSNFTFGAVSTILSLAWSFKPLYHLAFINTTSKYKYFILAASFLAAGISSVIHLLMPSSSIGNLATYFPALAFIAVAQVGITDLLFRKSDLSQSFLNSFSYVLPHSNVCEGISVSMSA
jgi:hypothetical protein